MMAWVHAAVGAALGGRVRSRRGAFAAGVASHLVCDLLPHRDYEMIVEMPLLAATLGLIGLRCGVDSDEFVGAMGAISPDVENGFAKIGANNEMFFPTHTSRKWFVGHGRRVKSPLPQVLLALGAFYLIETGRRRSRR